MIRLILQAIREIRYGSCRSLYRIRRWCRSIRSKELRLVMIQRLNGKHS